MLRQRIYYLLKPFMPWRLRMGVRRVFARRKLAACQDVWPIKESAGQTPAGWPGWPEGKKFAVVLTHDVEGPDGLAKCRKLAELEMELGFRSSFNFIPEGSYRVTPALRTWLTDNGFEVGVHDLQHNGKLFQSRPGFKKKAARINHYLRDWGAAGFRAGFMLRNLDWLHDLDIQYDASTFDTDPFEPQSDGAGTIFPFWIPLPHAPSAKSEGASAKEQEEPTSSSHSSLLPLTSHLPHTRRSGYVELPYTLPQDSTMFLLLRESSPEIWLRKTDWIAGHGGMVLVNVHPDYVRFAGEKESVRTFPDSYYRQLLLHLRERYHPDYWQALPKEIAAWCTGKCFPATAGNNRNAPITTDFVGESGSVGTDGLRGKRAAVLLYSTYPEDPRPRRAAEAMIEAGMTVDLFCLSENDDESLMETVRGIRVTRLRMKRQRGAKWNYFWQYSRFFAASFWFLARHDLRKKYDVVHVHNMPDFLVFAALIPKFRGARIMLDLHDPMPELMMSIYELKADSWQVHLLRKLERWSIRFADVVLTPNIAFKNLFASRSCRADKIQIVMNSPQTEIFDPDRFPPRRDGMDENGEFRVMHHGLIAHRHGVDQLVEAVAWLRPKIPGIHLDIYGGATPFLDTVLDVAQRLGVSDIVHFHGPKTQPEIADAIRRCHLGVVPNRRLSFTELNFPTRIFEYLAMHCPILAPRSRGICDYFSGEDLLFFEAGNPMDLAEKILWVHDHPAETVAIVRRGEAVYRAHLWADERERFLSLTRNQLLSSNGQRKQPS